jgi:hypothetical protein
VTPLITFAWRSSVVSKKTVSTTVSYHERASDADAPDPDDSDASRDRTCHALHVLARPHLSIQESLEALWPIVRKLSELPIDVSDI